ncbi:hypothetical protein ACTHGU_17215 [Chitinophagaceae bacterium MMS25-I14]
MKPVKQIILDVPQPCSQSWDKMTLADKGRFCDHCCKTVIDFSQMSDAAILQYIQQATNGICGRFTAEQLNRPLHTSQQLQHFPYRLLYAFLSLGLTAFAITPVRAKVPAAQYEVIKRSRKESSQDSISMFGRVTNAGTQQPMPHARVYITRKGQYVAETFTGAEGYYTLDISRKYLKKELSAVVDSNSFSKRLYLKKENNLINLYYTRRPEPGTKLILGSVGTGAPYYIIDGVEVNADGTRTPKQRRAVQREAFFRRLIFWK